MMAMEPPLDIPAPEPSDSETVASLLETAAVFGAKGDRVEALRWVQRAAESAGESGDDARTLALAHTAATLSGRLNGAAEDERRVPTPPSLPSSSAARTVEGEEDATLTIEGEEDATPFILESRVDPGATERGTQSDQNAASPVERLRTTVKFWAGEAERPLPRE